MKDLRRALRRRSERGDPIGSDRLRQRVAFELAGGHMRPEDTRRRIPGLAMAATAAVVVLLGFGGLVLLGGEEEPDVVGTHPTTTPTIVPTTTTQPAPSIIWTEANVPTRILIEQVVEGGPGLVAAGCVVEMTENTNYLGQTYFDFVRHWAIWTSSDGLTWTARLDDEAAETDRGCIADVVATPSGLFAVGTAEEPSGYKGVIWASDDGFGWERVDPAAMQNGAEIAEEIEVTADGTLVVAGSSGNEARVWTSVDGRDWTSVSDDDLLGRSFVEDLVAAPTGLLMVGSDTSSEYYPKPAAWFSTNGMDWDRIPAENIASGDPMGVVEYLGFVDVTSDGTWIIGDYTGRVWTSEDGAGWSPVYEADVVGDFAPVPKWAGHDDRLVAVSSPWSNDPNDPDNSIWISLDGGDTWFEDGSANIPTEVFVTAVFLFGDGFVAVGAESAPFTYPDPENKTSTRLWVGTWDD